MTKDARHPLTIVISRWFDAPPRSAFMQWTDAEALKDWFAPVTFEGVEASVDARVGGPGWSRFSRAMEKD